MKDFETLQKVSSQYGETNDCTVKAMAVALGTTYEDAHDLARRAGRRPGKGLVSSAFIRFVERDRGAKFERVYHRNDSRVGTPILTTENKKYLRGLKTVRQFRPWMFGGTNGGERYYARVSKHALGIADGEVVDFTKNRCHRFLTIWKCVDPGTSPSKPPTAPSKPPSHSTTVRSVRRTRKTSYCWKLVRLDTGETLAQWKRKPTKQIENIARGGYIPSLGRSVKIAIRPM